MALHVETPAQCDPECSMLQAICVWVAHCRSSQSSFEPLAVGATHTAAFQHAPVEPVQTGLAN